MISIEQLTLAYTSNHSVINHLNLTLRAAHIHGLVGLNGSGKTTLLHGMHGLLKPTKGSIFYQGKPLSKKEISLLPTENYFYPNITGREYLNLFGNQDFAIDDWNDLFHLPLDQIIDDYSTGMKKKLAILGVLKEDKPVLILDEPFNGLDLETGRVLHDVLSRLREKQKTILVTSHILESLLDLCDEIHYLESGKIQNSVNRNDFESFKNGLYQSMTQKNKDKIDSLL